MLTIGIYVSIACIITTSKVLLKKEKIHANISPKRILLNDAVTFYDSTENTNSILWEFGNGDKTKKKSGTYVYKKPGKYKARITIDENREATFIVDVFPQVSIVRQDTSVSIYADYSGIAGQKIHFKIIGENISWCEWSFNGKGKVDSRTQETFYTFNKPGTYNVLLVTNLNPQKPKRHTIIIEPPYKITENIVLKHKDKGNKAETRQNEFKDLLQEISFGNNFTSNYNYLLKNYLCANPRIKVLINNKEESDFYSYCQGLQINSNIIIKEVVLETNIQTKCIYKILIQQ